MIGKEKERSRIRTVQMDILRGLLGIRRMNGLRELCEVAKREDERILGRFGHIENGGIAKRAYEGVCR